MLLRLLKDLLRSNAGPVAEKPARDLEAHFELGVALEAQGRLPEAIYAWQQAVAIDPRCLPAWLNLQSAQLAIGNTGEALRCADEAIRIDPGSLEARMRRGDVLLARADPVLGAESYRAAVAIDPRSARAQVGLGWALEIAGDVAGARRCYESAVALEPGYVAGHVSLAEILLTQESFGAGWDEFEWRKRAPENAAVHDRFAVPEWDGSPPQGRRLLCYAEQGLGDQIMYASCLPDLLRKGAHCVIDCDPRLVELFRRSFPGTTVHGGRQSEDAGWLNALPPVDRKISLASLPRILRRSAADFPRHGGYLRADPGKVRRWQDRLAQLGPGLKVGLSWRGGVARTGQSWRSVEVGALEPLATAHAHFVSLQYGEQEADLGRLRQHHGVVVHRFQEALDDYDETAALLCALDLTLSVCTAVIHLAGALDRPVWVLAPFKPDARYGLTGEAMRWYSSARMFRQETFGDWAGVVERVRDALERFTANSG